MDVLAVGSTSFRRMNESIVNAFAFHVGHVLQQKIRLILKVFPIN